MDGHTKYRRSGFTFLEMMVVLLILGIIVATAVPAMNNSLNEKKLEGAAEEVSTAIRYVKSLSMQNQGTIYGVMFDSNGNLFRCYDKSTGDTILHPIDKMNYEIDFNKKRHIRRVDIIAVDFGGNPYVEFDARGKASAIGGVVLAYAGLQKGVAIVSPYQPVIVQ
jgi:prepilin-type N-terminal cleavage/methylation domain-containing protein